MIDRQIDPIGVTGPRAKLFGLLETDKPKMGRLGYLPGLVEVDVVFAFSRQRLLVRDVEDLRRQCRVGGGRPLAVAALDGFL